MQRRRVSRGSVFLGCAVLAVGLALAGEPVRIRMASTTSTQNSGLFDVLIPAFQRSVNGRIQVDVIAVGTGQALALGRRGDVDLVFVHAREAELRFVEEGYGVGRQEVMYNDFVLLGPVRDPARVAGLRDAAAALQRIAAARAPFVSRGDDSGTHKKEMALWRKARLQPRGQPWYLEAGQGMAATLRIASEKQAYTLSDRGTWLAVKAKRPLGLKLLVEGDPALHNPYGIMAVNPKRFPHVNYREAMAFIRWIVSPEGQRVIADFKDAQGNTLFHPLHLDRRGRR